jgi:Glycosyltransferase family 87
MKMTTRPQSLSIKNAVLLFSYLPCSLIVLWIFNYIFHLFHTYDWNQPFAKLICFTALFAGVFALSGVRKGDIRLSSNLYWMELLTFSGLFLWMILSWKTKYFLQLRQPPAVDIGYTTQHAAEMLFRHFENPYLSRTLNIVGLDPGYTGFKYGPIMILGYFPSAFFPQSGYKLMNLLYLLLSLGCTGYLAWRKNASLAVNLSTIVFVMTLILLPERLGFELFFQGANDIFPVFLLLLSVVFFKMDYELLAGLSAGLSFSAKFTPALFLIVLFIRKEFNRRFFAGVAIGLLPNTLFLGWDYSSFFKNAFVFNTIKKYDSTSLYSITPAELHFVFSLVQIGALLYSVTKNFWKRIEITDLTISFILLLIPIEATYRQVHTNHLIWFIPFLALVIGQNRHVLSGLLGELLEPQSLCHGTASGSR